MRFLLPLLLAASIVPCADRLNAQLFAEAGSLDWRDAPPPLPDGTKLAVLEGDPVKDGIYTIRLLVPAGSSFEPHWHQSDERVTVLSGRMEVSTKSDPSSVRRLGAGGFHRNAARAPHSFFFTSETVLQITGVGPWTSYPVAPAPAGKPRGEVRIVSSAPPEGTLLDKASELVLEVEYSIEPFKPETFRLAVLFDSTTPGHTFSVSKTVSTGPVSKPPRDGILTQASGRMTLRYPMRDIWHHDSLAKPVRVRVYLNEMVSETRAETIAQSGVIAFPAAP